MILFSFSDGLLSFHFYIAHRKQSYQYGSRKPLTNSMKRRDSSKDSKRPSITAQTSPTESALTSPSSTATGSPAISSKQNIAGIDEPLISERAGYGDHLSDTSSEGRHVQFEETDGVSGKGDVIALPTEDDNYDDNNDDLRKRKE